LIEVDKLGEKYYSELQSVHQELIERKRKKMTEHHLGFIEEVIA
jgi:hypothetical protein